MSQSQENLGIDRRTDGRMDRHYSPITLTKPTWCIYIVQRRQSHSGFHLRIFVLKDSNDELVLTVSGTLLQILGATYETVPVPYLIVLGFLE